MTKEAELNEAIDHLEYIVFPMAYKRAGFKKQLLKTCEECSELIKAIMKAQQDDLNGYSMNMIEEIGHVELCLDMLKYDMARIEMARKEPTTVLEFYLEGVKNRLDGWYLFEKENAK